MTVTFFPIGSITYSLMYGLMKKQRVKTKSINKIQEVSKIESSVSSSSFLDLEDEFEKRVFFNDTKDSNEVRMKFERV